MRKIKYILVASMVIAISSSSCKKYFDINDNPNDPTSSSPELILPQAIVFTAANTVSYNTYGSWMVGYTANAGGYGGWGSALTYNYGQNDYTSLWANAYNNLEDYQFILNQTQGDDSYAYYNSAARIMKAMTYQWLVDQYDDVPYEEALKGTANTVPGYEDGEDIYRDLYKQLDTAIAQIRDAQFPKTFANVLGNADPLFEDDMVKWIQLANTLKLKLLVRASGTDVFDGITPTFDPLGFLTEDALVNPGYSKANGKQNPAWNAYHSSYTGTGAARSLITTHFVLSFYNDTKISDVNRASAIYRGGVNPNRNQLGNTSEGIPAAPSGSPVWYSGPTFSLTADNAEVIGVLKGRAMGQPIMLAAESYFLQAEARLKGILTTGDDVKTLYLKGIEASFNYLYKNQSNTLNAPGDNPLELVDPEADAAAYLVEGDNENNRLVNIDLAATDEEKLEAIITQKYIALNMIHGHEAWAEFRRTGYPEIDNTAPLDRDLTFVSLLSTSTAPDKLLGRVLYPATEYQLNDKNVPAGISVFDSYVFWDRRN